MATSIHSGVVAFDATLYGTDDDPVDTVIWRDGVANGLLHAADSFAQQRVNLALPTGQYLETTGTLSATQWSRIGGSFGSWPLTLHSDGTPYKLRIRVGVSILSAGTSTVRVVIAPVSYVDAELDRDADHVYELTTTTTSAGWKDGASQGALASVTLLTVSASLAAEWSRQVSVYDAVSAGTPRTIDQCLVSAHVYAKSTIKTRLHNLYIAEYVGA